MMKKLQGQLMCTSSTGCKVCNNDLWLLLRHALHVCIAIECQQQEHDSNCPHKWSQNRCPIMCHELNERSRFCSICHVDKITSPDSIITTMICRVHLCLARVVTALPIPAGVPKRGLPAYYTYTNIALVRKDHGTSELLPSNDVG